MKAANREIKGRLEIFAGDSADYSSARSKMSWYSWVDNLNSCLMSASIVSFTKMGLLRNTIFRHPFTLFRVGSERSEGSYHRRDSSAFAAVGGTPPFGGSGLRMTAQTEFRNSPKIIILGLSKFFREFFFVLIKIGHSEAGKQGDKKGYV